MLSKMNYTPRARCSSLSRRVWIIAVIVIASSVVKGQSNQPNGPIRLWRNGVTLSSYTSGRVQILIDGQWGNICADELFTLTEANVVCHQLGFTGASSQSKQQSDSFGTDSLQIVMDKVRCYTSDYLVILQCSHITTISSSCTSSDDLSVTCFTARIWDNPYNGQVRLTGGTTVNQGLVEIYCNGKWGTVCAVGFNQTTANTICRQLGYSAVAIAGVGNSITNSTQPIWLDNVACSATERCLTNCKNCPVPSHNSSCTHSQDIILNCFSDTNSLRYTGTTSQTCQPNYTPGFNVPRTSNGPIRLSRNGVSSPSYSSGRVQIYFNNEWGNICEDDAFSLFDAIVICHQLGFQSAITFSREDLSSDNFGSDPLHTVLNNVDCSTSSYLVILQCSYSAVITPLCTDSRDVSVICSSTKIFFSGFVRLTNGAHVNQGVVEYSCGSVWSTICNGSSFGMNEANTVCRQLGYTTAYQYNHLSLSIPPESSDSMFLRDVSCDSPNLSCLSDCLTCANTNIGCPRTSYTTVECYSSTSNQVSTLSTCELPPTPTAPPVINNATNGPIRLVDRDGVPSFSSGRVEILINSRWGYICNDDMFGLNEGHVICHQLGYTGAMMVSTAVEQGFGVSNSTPVVLSGVSCSSSNFLVILQCSFSTVVEETSCPVSRAASVTCLTARIWNNPYDGQVRLTGGVTVNQGLVEVYCNGQWGTVCDDAFGQSDADTVCRQLGYSTAQSFNHLSLSGGTFEPIWFTGLSCSSQSCIGDCNRRCPSTSVSGCVHSEDVTILCTTSSVRVNTMTSTCTDVLLPENHTGAIVGGVIAGLVVLGIIAFIIYHSERKKKNLPIVPSKVTNCWNQTKASYRRQKQRLREMLSRRPRLPRFRQQQESQPSQPSTPTRPSQTASGDTPPTNSQPSNSQPSPAASNPPAQLFPATNPPAQPFPASNAPAQPFPAAPNAAPFFTQAPPPTYDRHDNFATKVEPPKEDELDLPPPYEPPSAPYLGQSGQYELNIFAHPPPGSSQAPVAYIPNVIPSSEDF